MLRNDSETGYAPVLAAAHMQQPLPQIQLLAAQADQFRDAQPVPVGEQDHRGVAVAMASEPLRRGDQPVDFRRRQVLPAAALGVGDLGRGLMTATFPKMIFGTRPAVVLRVRQRLGRKQLTFPKTYFMVDLARSDPRESRRTP